MSEHVLTIAGQVLALFGEAEAGESRLRALLGSGLLETVLEADLQAMSYERLESVRKSLGLPTLLEFWEKPKDLEGALRNKDCRCGRSSTTVMSGKIRGLTAAHEEMVCPQEECRTRARKFLVNGLTHHAERRMRATSA